MKRMKTTALGLVAVMALLMGCANVNLEDPFNDRSILHDTQKEFNNYLRWGVIDKAAQFVVAEQRAEFQSIAPHLSDLRISNYETIHVKQTGENEAEVMVRYEGYSMVSPIQRSIILEQTWTRDVESEFWLVRLEVNRLRDALGLAAR